MSKQKLSRRDKEKNKRKEEILTASLQLFSEKGYHNVSMQEIAQKSEFSVGTLYNFFQSKDALFEELIDDGSERILKGVSEILDVPGNEKDLLTTFIRQQPELQEKHGELIKLYVSEFGIKGSKLSKIRSESKVHQLLNLKLAQLIEQGIRKKNFRAVDPEITAKTLSSIIETLIFETTGRFEKDAIIVMFRKVEQLFLDGLLIPGDRNE